MTLPLDRLLAQKVALGIALLLAIGCQRREAAISEAVKLTTGAVSGVVDDSVTSFKGIPFAAPPIGKLRWKPPQPVAPWPGVMKCESFGPSPMQPAPSPFMVYTSEFLIPSEPVSEDCLYLNVWTAASYADERRPVLVWIYGGGFSSGGSAVPIYNGAAMARKGLVFVSVNYRVGIFGFFAHPGLTMESPEKASGNYGLMDQIAALKWVRDNIAAFGGDPGNVTIAGQSAGSYSVSYLVASPLATGLFHRAIAESGSGVIQNGIVDDYNLRAAERKGVRVAQGLYASTIEDLRGVPADTLLTRVRERFGPIADGYVLPAPAPELFAKGSFNRVPLLTGWNADEGFVWTTLSRAEYIAEAKSRYGADAEIFLTHYPASSDEALATSRALLSRDMLFALPNYRWAVIQSRDRTTPAYVYYFKRRPPASPEFEKYKAFHTAEVPYALDNLSFVNRPWQPADRRFASVMSSYWANFAAGGDPNGPGLPPWPVYDSASNEVMIFGDSVKSGTLPGREALEFLARPRQ